MISKKLIRKYLKYCLMVRGCAIRTVEGYSYDLNTFLVYVNKMNFEKITFEKILEFIVYLRSERSNESGAITRKLTTLKGYFGFLISTEEMKKQENPLKYLPKIRNKRKKLPVVLSKEEIEKIIKVIPVDTKIGYRDYVIITTLYSTGIRVSELCGMKIKDVDFSNKTIRVVGKGDRERLVPMTNKLIEVLEKYLEMGNYKSINDSVFQSKRGGGLKPAGVYRRVRDYGKIACISKPVTPHKFRHSCATHLIKAGVEISVVSELLGHANISSTHIYIHVNIDELLLAAENHPVNLMNCVIPVNKVEMPFQGEYLKFRKIVRRGEFEEKLVRYL